MLTQEDMNFLEEVLKDVNYESLYEKIKKDQDELAQFVLQKQKYKENQMKGIEEAQKAGVRFGRPKIVLNNNKKFSAVADMYEKKKITSRNAAKILNVSQSTFLKNYKKEVR